MHVLNHADKHLSVRGPLTVRRSPQGRPILVQAGVSEPGQQIAAEYCDMVFMAKNDLRSAQANAALDRLSTDDITRLPIEAGDPATDDRLFRRCLGQYGTGIAIITTETEGRRAAVTVNSFAPVSLDPPLVLWSITHTSRSYPLFKNGRCFAVNILSSTQMNISRHFSSKVEDKLADAVWSPGEFGSPLLDGCLAHFECETYSQVEGGDHTILIGLVRRASRFEREPLLFVQGQYSVADFHPGASPLPEVGGSKPETSLE